MSSPEHSEHPDSSLDSHTVDAYSKAIRFYREGAYKESFAILNDLSQIAPERHDIWHLLGVICQQLGQSHSAIPFIQRALSLAPSEPAYWNNLSLAIASTGKLTEAEVAMCEAVRLQPQSADLWMNLGNVYSRKGNFAQAHSSYTRALQIDARHPGALMNLGNSLVSSGKIQEGILFIQQAVDYSPNYFDAVLNLAKAYRKLSKFDQAKSHYQRALLLNPQHATAQMELGLTLIELNESQQAEAHLRRATQLAPNFSDAWCNLGNLLLHTNNLASAESCLLHAIELNSTNAIAYCNLGELYRRQEKWPESEVALTTALTCLPNLIEVHLGLGNVFYDRGRGNRSGHLFSIAKSHYRNGLNIQNDHVGLLANLGGLLSEMGEFEEAERCLRRAVSLMPNNSTALINLGNLLRERRRPEEAIEFLERAIELSPNSSASYQNLGNAWRDLGEFETALSYYNRAIELSPNHPELRKNRALIWLIQGNFQQGWPEFDERLKTVEFAASFSNVSQPRWRGESLAGKTILLIAEQGLGDTLQFIRYAPLLKKLEAKVIVAAQQQLLPLLSRCDGVDGWISLDAKPPQHDFYCPLMSVPQHFDFIPTETPYLFAQDDRVVDWRKQLEHFSGLRVGIGWQGNPRFKTDYLRSVPLINFAPLFELPGVTFFSLQKGDGVDQLHDFPALTNKPLPIVELGTSLDVNTGAFEETAAVITNLDLVIHSDTALVHLAGGLGIPVWMPTSSVPDWRWQLGREDSPWYPKLRLFRQRVRGRWDDVFRAIRDQLEKKIAERHESNQL